MVHLFSNAWEFQRRRIKHLVCRGCFKNFVEFLFVREFAQDIWKVNRDMLDWDINFGFSNHKIMCECEDL